MRNSLQGMTSATILAQDFLRCNSYESLPDPQQNQVQEIFNRTQLEESRENPIYRSEDAHLYETIHAMTHSPQQKIESVSGEGSQSLPILEGKFKKKDAKNIQRIKELTQILIKYDPDHFSFNLHFNMIMNLFKKLNASSSKLAAFLYVLDSTGDKERSKLQVNDKKLYEKLPEKYKNLIKRSNPQFSIDMRSSESTKSIRAYLEKRAIFVKTKDLTYHLPEDTIGYNGVENIHLYESIEDLTYCLPEDAHIYESIGDLTYRLPEEEAMRHNEAEGTHLYETINTVTHSPQQKTESVLGKGPQSLSILEGKFKKKDAKNIQRIKELTQTLIKYEPDHFSFNLHFNMIMNVFKKLNTSLSKLAAFIYVLDSTRDKEGATLQISSKKLYKELPKKCKKLIKKSNPQFSVDMRSDESAKSIKSIRAYLEKHSIFVKLEE